MNTTAERLQAYYPFSQEVIDNVTEAAERQASYPDHQAFFDAAGVGSTFVWHEGPGKLSAEMLDIRPAEHDPAEAVIVRLPMANPLDGNQIFQIATLAATQPNKRIIAVGNTSGGSYGTSGLPHKARKQLAHGDFSPVSEPVRHYAELSGVERLSEIGYSYGAKAAAYKAAQWNVDRLVVVEPVVGKRSLPKLGLDFASTAKALQGYFDATGLEIFAQARKEGLSGLQYNLGLLRLTNIATARGLAQGDAMSDIEDILRYTDAGVTLAWGSESELTPDTVINGCIRYAQRFHSAQRLRDIRLEGQKHALANDLHLMAAIVGEGLKTS